MATKSTKKPEVKKEEVKTAPAAVAAPAKAAPVEAAKPAAKPAEKAAPAKTEKAAPAKAEKAPAKTAAKAEKVAPAKKTAAKSTKKTAEKKAPAKKAPAKKAKPITVEDICAKLEKKIDKTKAAKLADKIAVDVQIWGWEDGTQRHLYIEVKDGKATVAPYDYMESNFNAYINVADALAIVDGKLTIMDALMNGKLNAIGVVGDAVKLASIF